MTTSDRLLALLNAGFMVTLDRTGSGEYTAEATHLREPSTEVRGNSLETAVERLAYIVLP